MNKIKEISVIPRLRHGKHFESGLMNSPADRELRQPQANMV